MIFKRCKIENMDKRKRKGSPIPFPQELSEIAITVTDYLDPNILDSVYPNRIRKVRSQTSNSFSNTPCNTLRMISTPWSTESWYSVSSLINEHSSESDYADTSYPSSSSGSSYMSMCSTASFNTPPALPKATITLGVQKPSVRTFSKTTITCISLAPTIKDSPKTYQDDLSQTLSSWSLETFTSAGILPWNSGSSNWTDCYPSRITTNLIDTERRGSSPNIPSSIISPASLHLLTTMATGFV